MLCIQPVFNGATPAGQGSTGRDRQLKLAALVVACCGRCLTAIVRPVGGMILKHICNIVYICMDVHILRMNHGPSLATALPNVPTHVHVRVHAWNVRTVERVKKMINQSNQK